jgi:pimeloyl-ACP methyl ester carboxylesterase
MALARPTPTLLDPEPLLAAAPPRPGAGEERLASFFLNRFGPRLARVEPQEPPGHLAPFEQVGIPRRDRRGALAGTWYPAGRKARGAVLLSHPWVEWGRAYFHRRGRLEALRAAGYHALAFDLSGLGGSPPRAGFRDRDLEDALAWLRRRAPGVPVHVWGVSAGGYWAHPLLTRGDGVAGAMFEEVSPHLIEWSHRMAPRLRPAYGLFRRLVPNAFRYLDLRGHAPFLRVRAAAYAFAELDAGIPAEDGRELARRAGAECLVVPGAGHLGAIKLAPDAVIGLALETFERAVRPR